MVSYVDVCKKALKPRDSIAEVFLNDPVTIRITYIVSRYLPSMRPMHFTLLGLMFRITAAISFAVGALVAGAVLAYVGFLCDGVDGKLSRIRYGRDPEVRGTADFVFDQVAFASMTLGLMVYSIGIGTTSWTILLGIWLALSYIFETLTSTRYRLLLVSNGEIATTLIHKKGAQSQVWSWLGGALRIRDQIVQALTRFRLSPETTTVESEVLLFTLAPLVGMPLWIGIAALLPLVMTIIIYASAIIVLLSETTDPSA